MTVAIIKDRHVRIIIMRPETILHLEAGYIFADCFSSQLIPLAVRRRTIHVTTAIRPSFENLIQPFRELCERLLLQAERQDKRVGNYGVRCIVGTRPVGSGLL